MKARLAAWSFAVASLVTLAGMVLPPLGVIDSSVLIVVGQFLILSATLLGVDSYVDQIKKLSQK